MVAKRAGLQLTLLAAKPIEKTEIPVVTKKGIIRALPQFKDVVTIAKAVKENGIGPYEAFDVVDFDVLKKSNTEAAKMKTLVFSFISAARAVLKEFQVEKELELKQRKNRLFLVAAGE